VKLEILPGPRLEVDVTATRALSRPLVPLAKRAFDLLLRHLGGEPLGKVM
jgi:hypothetical protein